MSKTFFHGHSFTANPISCAAANASLDLLETHEVHDRIVEIHNNHKTYALSLANNPKVENVRVKGTLLALDVKSDVVTGYGNAVRDEINTFFLEKGILLRPLGNTIYLLPPYCISDNQLQQVYQAINEYLLK
jgi:adenosylmethionine-8-amino-7-oxononanoate aminotransferase